MHGGDPLLSGVRYIIAVFLLLQGEEGKEDDKEEEDDRDEDKEKVGEKEKEVEKEREKGKYKEKDKEKEEEKDEEEDVSVFEWEKDNFDSYDDNEDLAFIQTFLSTYRDHLTILSVDNDLSIVLPSLPSSHLSSESAAGALTETKTGTGTGAGEGARVPLNGARVPLKDTIYNPTEKKNFTFGFGFEFSE